MESTEPIIEVDEIYDYTNRKRRVVEALMFFMAAVMSFIALYSDYMKSDLVDMVHKSSRFLGIIMPIVWIICGMIILLRGIPFSMGLFLSGVALSFCGVLGFQTLAGIIDNPTIYGNESDLYDIQRIVLRSYHDMPDGENKKEVKRLLDKGIYLDDIDKMTDSFMSKEDIETCLNVEKYIDTKFHKGKPRLYFYTATLKNSHDIERYHGSEVLVAIDMNCIDYGREMPEDAFRGYKSSLWTMMPFY